MYFDQHNSNIKYTVHENFSNILPKYFDIGQKGVHNLCQINTYVKCSKAGRMKIFYLFVALDHPIYLECEYHETPRFQMETNRSISVETSNLKKMCCLRHGECEQSD